MKDMHITNVEYQEFTDEFYFVTYPGVRPYMYGVNIYGEFASFVPNRERKLKPDYDRGGYERYRLRTTNPADDKYMHVLASRMVAWEFVGKPENYMELEVNHVDGIHMHNFYKNLEWVTTQENTMHKVIHGLAASSEKHGWNKHREDVVRDVISLMEMELPAPDIAAVIIQRYPKLYSKHTKRDYDRIRGLVSKIKNRTSWYRIADEVKGSTTIESIIYEKHIGEEVSRVGLHPIVVPNGRYLISGKRK